MKSFITFLFISLNHVLAQGLFFSEAAEGSSNNKYLEIFNSSASSINLSDYSISRCSNGCEDDNTFEYPDAIPLNDIYLSSGEVYVVCATSASDGIHQECDQTYQILSNGDDFTALTKISNGEVIDKIGDFGADPGSGWDVAGISSANERPYIGQETNRYCW